MKVLHEAHTEDVSDRANCTGQRGGHIWHTVCGITLTGNRKNKGRLKQSSKYR